MNTVKHIFSKVTGYWIHKLNTLPIGTDLFYDITQRLGYSNVNIVFDVGANEGQTVRWIKHHLPYSVIYVFEPVCSTYNKLKIAIAHFTKIHVENLALGDLSGTKIIKLFTDYSVLNSLTEHAMNHEVNATEELIKIDTLDNYCHLKNIEKIDLLKIDTEGYEINVLKGANKLLDEKRISFIYCEVGFNESNQRNTSFALLTSFLEAKGYFFYAMYQIDSHGWKNGNHLANALFIQKDIFP
jgi:FkbM family methyltransferase